MDILKHRQILPNGCWNWTGAITYNSTKSSAYGRCRHNGKLWRVHRLSYMLHHPVVWDDSVLILHKCNNSLCFNPAHLYIGTVSDNTHDSIQAGTHWFSENRGRHR
jgi:hypothetical protein